MQEDSLLLDTSLERAAEALGDITEPVMAHFYRAHPEAREAFEHHSRRNRGKLEADMVDAALYWAMNWRDRRDEIRIHLGSSVPHHEETLKVALPWYRGLLESVIDVIVQTIPSHQTAELALWNSIRAELGQTIEASRSPYVTRAGAAA